MARRRMKSLKKLILWSWSKHLQKQWYETYRITYLKVCKTWLLSYVAVNPRMPENCGQNLPKEGELEFRETS